MNEMYRELILVDNRTWDALPKSLRGIPVFYRVVNGKIELWPQWTDDISNPRVAVYP